MKNILFVDDEPKLLEGLRRMLRGMRHEWEMSFAGCASEALKILATKPFNVVVTDMRMPGMDGSELLERVKELHPQTVRIILSGQSDKETILKAVGPAHQYLSKPCDAEILKNTIGRVCAMRHLLEDKELIQVISGIESLPSVPALYTQLVDEMSSPEGSLNKVGEIIARDAGMSAKILQLVNSAFFGLPRNITNPVRAVNLLGLEIVKSLVLSVKIFSSFSRANLPGYSVDELWKHSLATALTAKKIAQAFDLGQDGTDEAFMAGLLHDTGRLIILDRLTEKCRQVLEDASSAKCPVWEAEQHLIGTTHAQIGAYLLGIWGLSDSVVESVSYHHSPGSCMNQKLGTLTAVYLANIFEGGGPGENESVYVLDTPYLEKLGILKQVETLREEIDPKS